MSQGDTSGRRKKLDDNASFEEDVCLELIPLRPIKTLD